MQEDPGVPDGWADVPRAEGDGARLTEPAPGAPTPGDEPLLARPRRRRSARRGLGRRGVVLVVAGAVVLVLLVVAGFGADAAGRVRYAPSKQVEAFLDDVVAGHVGKALAAAGMRRDGDPLLTDAAYRSATDRVTAYRIESTQVSGGTATVQALLRQGGSATPATFTLDASGSAWGVFTTWRLAPVALGSVEAEVEGPGDGTVAVAGASARTGSDGTAAWKAFPGTYRVSLVGDADVAAAPAESVVRGFGGAGSSPAALRATLTPAGQRAATAAVDAWIAGCVASTDLVPSGCSFEAYGETAGYTYTNRKWTLNHAPTFAIGGWTGSGWAVRTTAAGSVTFTEDISGPAGSGTGTAGPITFSADGLITGVSGGSATYRSLVTGGGGAASGT